MSKPLKTVQELWSYCLCCPVCDDTSREIVVSAGPEDKFKLVFFKKEDNILNIQCVYKNKFLATYDIDCLNNTFKICGNEPNLDKTYCYFCLQSVCRQCNASHATGSDLELSWIDNSINHIGIEREGVYILSTKDKYHVSMIYENSTMIVSKCFKDKDGQIIDDNRICILPLVDLDFSEPRKTAHRIKTMLVFSCREMLWQP